MHTLITVGYVILYAALQKALPLLDHDEAARRTALSLQALCEDRLGIPRRRPTHAERRGQTRARRGESTTAS